MIRRENRGSRGDESRSNVWQSSSGGRRSRHYSSAFLPLLAATLVGACTDTAPEIPPRQISESSFHYPEALWDAGVEGETLLEIHVSRVGTVDSARVERTSGHAEFDSAAINGAHQLRFEPARRGADSIAVRVHLPVQFQIPQNDSPTSDTPSVPSQP